MSKMLDHNTIWVLRQDITSSGTLKKRLYTRNTFVDKYIDIETVTPAGAETISGGVLTPGNGSAALTSAGLSNGETIDSTKKITLTDQDQEGYYELDASGSGTVNRSAVNKYVDTPGFIERENVDVISADSAQSNTETKKYYVKQSEITSNNISPQTSQQTITVSSGYYHEDRTITIDPMDLASFSNQETSGVQYNDISSTAPELQSGGYLYVNAGYSDNVKISLAKLVPNAADIKGHSEYILSGHTAYDEDGILVSGSVPTYDYSYIVT